MVTPAGERRNPPGRTQARRTDRPAANRRSERRAAGRGGTHTEPDRSPKSATRERKSAQRTPRAAGTPSDRAAEARAARDRAANILSRVMLPERRRGPGLAIAFRLFVALSCLVVVAGVVYSERAGYRDVRTASGQVETLLDAIYYATVTLSTTGYGDITPVSESARLTNVLLVTPLRIVFLFVLVGTTIELLAERSRQQFRYYRWRRRVKKHTVIIGFGTKGRSAARSLIDAGYQAERIVVVDVNGANVKAAAALGYVGVLGDARREEILTQASVSTAREIVVAADRDDTNVLVTLTARRLSPDATIAVAAREEQNIGVLRQGGADIIIPTAESAGRMLGLSLAAPNAGEVIEDLLEPAAGLQIVERPVRPEDVGLTPARLTAQGEIVLTVVRGGHSYRFDSGRIRVFQPGDVIVVIKSTHAPGTDSEDAS